MWEIMDDLWFHEGNLEKRFQEPEQDNGSEAAEEERTVEVVNKYIKQKMVTN